MPHTLSLPSRDFLAWLCDRLSPSQQHRVLLNLIHDAELLLAPPFKRDHVATRTVTLANNGDRFLMRTSVCVRDQRAIRLLRQGLVDGTLVLRAGLLMDTIGSRHLIHLGASCWVGGQLVATLMDGATHLEVIIGSDIADNVIDASGPDV